MKTARTAPSTTSTHNVDWGSVVSDYKSLLNSFKKLKAAMEGKAKGENWPRSSDVYIGVDLRGWLEFNFNGEPAFDEVLAIVTEMRNLPKWGPSASEFRDIEQKMKRAESLIRQALSKAGPGKYSYKGVRILNSHRVIEPLLAYVNDGIDYLTAMFKKRGVEGILLESLNFIEVAPSGGRMGAAAGAYSPNKKSVSIYGHALKDKSGRFLQSWMHEVLIHEIGHHAQLNFMTPKARNYWDSGWSYIDAAAEVLQEKADLLFEEDIKLTLEDRKRYWKLLENNGFEPKKVAKILSKDLVDRTRFMFWLKVAEYTKQLSSPTLTKKGKSDFKLLQNLSNPAGLKTWGEEKFLDSYHVRSLKRQRKRFLSDEEYESEIQTLRSKFDLDTEVEANLSYIKKKLELTEGRDRTIYKSDLNAAVRKLKEYKNLIKKKEEQTEALGIPSDYGKTNSKEDFAESFVLWIRNPRRLSDVAQYRMARTLWLSGYGGQPVMRMAHRVATAFLAKENR